MTRIVTIDNSKFVVKKSAPSPLSNGVGRAMTNKYSKLFDTLNVGDSVGLGIKTPNSEFLKAYSSFHKAKKKETTGKKIAYRTLSDGITVYCIEA